MFEGYRLKTLKSFPPKGWLFKQPETGWEAPRPLVDDFWHTVDLIAFMRKQNPRFTHLSRDEDQIADELERYTVCRLKGDSQWCTTADVKKNAPARPGTGSSSRNLMQRAVAGAAGLVAAAKHTATGALILKDWLGAGGIPVPEDKAIDRSQACFECPKNWRGDWRTKVTGAVAEKVLEQRRMKLQLDLTVPNEEQLGTCDVCLCHLPLKVWVPLLHILAHTSKELMADFPSNCWIPLEANHRQ